MNNGGYDVGYKSCSCFWGNEPGSLVVKLDNFISKFNGLDVLDLGCGEGKNAIFLADKGCAVDAFEISDYALRNAHNICKQYKNIKLYKADVRTIKYPKNKYDIIISYGLFHCFESKVQVEKIIKKCLMSLKGNGFLLLCAFNNRKQDLSAHENFNPLLLSHTEYLEFFKSYEILHATDQDLVETHPHNNIEHIHSMTRILVKS